MLDPFATTTLAEVYVYMGSPTGSARVQAELTRRRLPGFLDTEIEEVVLGEAHRFLSNGGEITNIAAWCNHRIAARAIDLARGAIRDEARFAARVDTDPALLEVHDDEPELEPSTPLPALQAALLRTKAPAELIAAALAYIARTAQRAELAPACPQPKSGATANDAACWAGLWYSGQTQCFGPGNTVTKRRNRAAARLRGLLRQTVTDLATPAHVTAPAAAGCEEGSDV